MAGPEMSKYQPDYRQRYLPEFQSQYSADKGSKNAADGAERQPYRGENPCELAYVERRFWAGRGCARRLPAWRSATAALISFSSAAAAFAAASFCSCSLMNLTQFFIRRPERLTDADWMVEDAYDGGIPVLAFTIVENAIAAHHEKIRIASGKGGSDAHFFGAALAHAIAICQIKAAHVGELRMLGDILNPTHRSQLRPSRYSVPTWNIALSRPV